MTFTICILKIKEFIFISPEINIDAFYLVVRQRSFEHQYLAIDMKYWIGWGSESFSSSLIVCMHTKVGSILIVLGYQRGREWYPDRTRGLQHTQDVHWQFRQLRQHQSGSEARETRASGVQTHLCLSVQRQQQVATECGTVQERHAFQGKLSVFF